MNTCIQTQIQHVCILGYTSPNWTKIWPQWRPWLLWPCYINANTICFSKGLWNEDTVSHSCTKRLLLHCTAKQLQLSFFGALGILVCYLGCTTDIVAGFQCRFSAFHKQIIVFVLVCTALGGTAGSLWIGSTLILLSRLNALHASVRFETVGGHKVPFEQQRSKFPLDLQLPYTLSVYCQNMRT